MADWWGWAEKRLHRFWFGHPELPISAGYIVLFAVEHTRRKMGVRRLRRRNVPSGITEVLLLRTRSMKLMERDFRFIDKAFAHGDVPGIHWLRPGEQVWQ